MRYLRIAILTLSLLLLAATVAIWVRTHRTGDVLVWEKATRHYEIATIPGQVRFTVADGWINPKPLRHYTNDVPTVYPVFGQRFIAGPWYPPGVHSHSAMEPISTFSLGPSAQWAIRVSYRIYAFPLALPVAMFLAYPAWDVLIARRRRLRHASRLREGSCIGCGYDLRASTERCPECGRACVRTDHA